MFPLVFRLGWSSYGASILWTFTIRGKMHFRVVSLGYVLSIIRIRAVISSF